MASVRTRRILLVLSGVALPVLAMEVGLRAIAGRSDLLLALSSPAPLPPPGAELRFIDLLEPDPNARIVYRLRPGIRGHFRGVSHVTSSLGVRGAETTTNKPEGVLRIVGIGDSIQFGWGVEPGARYLDVLAASLSASGVRTEAVNLAVPGYNTVMEVATLRERGIAFEPDLVVLGFYENDLQLPNFLWGGGVSPWSLRRSFLLAWLARRLARGSDDDSPFDAHLQRAVEHVENPDAPRSIWRVESRFRSLAGRDNFLAALDELRDLSREHGFAVVGIAYPKHPLEEQLAQDRFYDACRERGFLAVDPRPAMRRELEARSLGPRGFWLIDGEPGDEHPNPLGHEILARVLKEAITAEDGPAPFRERGR